MRRRRQTAPSSGVTAPDVGPLVAHLPELPGLRPVSGWVRLRTNADATTWRAGGYVVKVDATGHAATVLPILRGLGLPVPELCAHVRLPDGGHLTVTR